MACVIYASLSGVVDSEVPGGARWVSPRSRHFSSSSASSSLFAALAEVRCSASPRFGVELTLPGGLRVLRAAAACAVVGVFAGLFLVVEARKGLAIARAVPKTEGPVAAAAVWSRGLVSSDGASDHAHWDGTGALAPVPLGRPRSAQASSRRVPFDRRDDSYCDDDEAG